MLYGQLSAKHPDYDPDLWTELWDFYRGGPALLAKAEKYLPRLVGEHPERHKERVRSAGYLAYFGEITDSFSSSLFGQPLTVAAESGEGAGRDPAPDFYALFAKDADRQRTPFVELLRAAFTSALVHGKSLVGVDLPISQGQAQNRADEERLGVDRAYAMTIPLEQLLDWERDDCGAFQWLILHRVHQRREAPEVARRLVVEEFKVWRRDDAGVTWELYRTPPYDPAREKPRDEDEVPEVGRGGTSFREIPILELVIPPGLWVGGKLGSVAKEHFQRRTSLVAAENRSLVALPVAKLGPETASFGGALPAEAATDPHRGHDPVAQFIARGFAVIGKDDEILFAEPEGKAYALVDGQLSDLKDEMFRVVHQLAASVSNTPGTLGRSGLSKQEDRVAEATVLGAYGQLVRIFAERIYETISLARRETATWAAQGADKFEAIDRGQVVGEANQLGTLAIPSRTFRAAYMTDVALKLVPNASFETKKTIREEIEAGIDSEETMASILRTKPDSRERP